MTHYSLQPASPPVQNGNRNGWAITVLALAMLAVLAWAWTLQQAADSPLPQAGPPSSSDSALA